MSILPFHHFFLDKQANAEAVLQFVRVAVPSPLSFSLSVCYFLAFD
jgi:hypothetical protein